MSLFETSQNTVDALLAAITECAERARLAADSEQSLEYARAAEALGAALASHADWNTPSSARSNR